MVYEEFKRNVMSLKQALAQQPEEAPEKSMISDFKRSRSEHLAKAASGYVSALKRLAPQLDLDPQTNTKVQSLVSQLDHENKEDVINQIIEVLAALPHQSHSQSQSHKGIINSIPSEIKGEIVADLKELEKCFSAECYRSATILCGRMLETALHRKYFEITGKDILEKNPGIGLGNLIGKLAEKNVTFDPGLTQQIHLINQVRVFSVHKKKEAFYPSKAQAEAMKLYTLDILEKIFAK